MRFNSSWRTRSKSFKESTRRLRAKRWSQEDLRTQVIWVRANSDRHMWIWCPLVKWGMNRTGRAAFITSQSTENQLTTETKLVKTQARAHTRHARAKRAPNPRKVERVTGLRTCRRREKNSTTRKRLDFMMLKKMQNTSRKDSAINQTRRVCLTASSRTWKPCLLTSAKTSHLTGKQPRTKSYSKMCFVDSRRSLSHMNLWCNSTKR